MSIKPLYLEVKRFCKAIWMGGSNNDRSKTATPLPVNSRPSKDLKFNVLQKLLLLAGSCLKNESLVPVAFESMTDFGRKISAEKQAKVNEYHRAWGMRAIKSRLIPNMEIPSEQILSKIAAVDASDKKSIIKEVGKLTPAETLTVFHPNFKYHLVHKIYERQTSGAEHSNDQELLAAQAVPQLVYQVVANVIAYHIYTQGENKVPDPNARLSRKTLELHVKVARVYSYLGNKQKALSVINDILEKISPDILATDVYGTHDVRPSPLAYMLQVVKEIAPELFGEEGFSLVVDSVKAKPAPGEEERQTLISASKFFPEAIVNKRLQEIVPLMIKQKAGEEVAPAAAQLIEEVRKSGQPLLFTRNISLRELADIGRNGQLCVNGQGVKFYRYGIDHLYGDCVIIMKSSFWEREKQHSYLNNIFNKKLTPQGPLPIMPAHKPSLDQTELLSELARHVEYNRVLGGQDLLSAFDLGEHKKPVGMTVQRTDQVKYMGLNPQLEVRHDVPLDEVEAILIPEYLWPSAEKICETYPEFAPLLRKVSGTGQTKAEFMAGCEKIIRRSSLHGGRDPDTHFGSDSFHLFEQEYFRLVLKQAKADRSAKAIAPEGSDYSTKVIGLMEKYGPSFIRDGWIFGLSAASKPLQRADRDWKIFVNPRQEKFLAVLEAGIKVLSDNRELGIMFKVPEDLERTWTGRKIGSSANTPKIVIYVNYETLPIILEALERQLKDLPADFGFGDQPGPSFTRKFGRTGLIFYKREYGNGEDQRAKIANQVEELAENKGKSPKQLLWLKGFALRAAGFDGENSYKRKEDEDPADKPKSPEPRKTQIGHKVS